MRILIVNRHYGSEHVPTGRMIADLAFALLNQGHEVIVLTARSSYASTSEAVTAPHAVTIRYLFTFGERYRVLSWILFLVQAWLRIPFMRWDRCLFLTDPPFLAAFSILMRPFGGKHPAVFWWTMDLYPEILVSSGRLRESSLLVAFFRRLNTEILRRVAGCIVLGNRQQERMRLYPTFGETNVLVVPPWDRRPIRKVERAANRFLKEYGLTNKKIALYAGNLGEGHIFTPIVDAAHELAKIHRDDWVIVFVIRGSKRHSLAEAAKNLPQVLILDYQPLDWTSDLLWSAHVHLITMSAGSEGVVVPSKLYGVLQTETPVLFIGPENADTAQEIRRYHAGEVLSQDSGGPEVLAALDRLCSVSLTGSSLRIAPDNTGPETIAAFITR